MPPNPTRCRVNPKVEPCGVAHRAIRSRGLSLSLQHRWPRTVHVPRQQRGREGSCWVWPLLPASSASADRASLLWDPLAWSSCSRFILTARVGVAGVVSSSQNLSVFWSIPVNTSCYAMLYIHRYVLLYCMYLQQLAVVSSGPPPPIAASIISLLTTLPPVMVCSLSAASARRPHLSTPPALLLLHPPPLHARPLPLPPLPQRHQPRSAPA